MESQQIDMAIKVITKDLDFVDGVDPKTILPAGSYKLTGKVTFNGVEVTTFNGFDTEYVNVTVYSDVYFLYAVSSNQARRNNYATLYKKYTYETQKWTPDDNSKSFIVDFPTKSYIDERTIGKTITKNLAFADNSDPSDLLGSGWYIFKGTVTFNGEACSWIDAYSLVQVRSYSNIYYMYFFSPDDLYRSSRIATYRYYDHSTKKWYPEVNANAYSVTALTTSSGLSKTNTTEYTPTENYNPATKKYVDDSTAGKLAAHGSITGVWGGSQAEYDALTTKDPQILYLIQE
jgi:hypothetical protein